MTLNRRNKRVSVKQRKLDYLIKSQPYFVTEDGKSWFPLGASPDRLYEGKQFTVSESHRFNKKHGIYASGGEFFTYRIQPEFHFRPVNLHWNKKAQSFKYDGPLFVPVGLTPSIDSLIPSEDSSYLDPVGAEAISIVDPTNPNADLGVALGEIILDRRISIPGVQAWKRRTEKLVAAGSEFLSAQFGWLPLIEEMKNTFQSIRDADTIVENYQNAAGTHVHREFEFPWDEDENESVYTNSTAATAGGATLNIPGSVPQVVTKREYTKTRRWFSGSFTYHGDARNHLEHSAGINTMTDKLFGSAITPELVWELTPWTWALDWFSNVGSVVSNANSFALAGLVMKYGYIMEETYHKESYTMPSTGYSQLEGSVPDCARTIIVKRRREANPFGFGIGWEGLSPTQLAITAALGITRVL